MNIPFILPFLSIFLSCSVLETKFIRKKIEARNLTVKWYYYSYISNTSPDFVVIQKDGNEKEIYKAEGVIADVSLIDSNIVLKLVSPSEGLVFTRDVEKEIYGYKIILDSTAKADELWLRPDGVKENN